MKECTVCGIDKDENGKRHCKSCVDRYDRYEKRKRELDYNRFKEWLKDTNRI